MNNYDFFNLIFFVLSIYLFGSVFFLIFFRKLFNKINLFIQISSFWILGNSLLMFLLLVLFLTNFLVLVNRQLILISVAILFITFLLIFLQKKIGFDKEKNHWFLLLLILLFFYPLIKNSISSFLIGWDAAAIWFLKAKALFNNIFPSYLKDENYLFSSQSYPIGVPLMLFAIFKWLGKINDQLVQFYFLNFYLNLIFLSFGIMIFLFKQILSQFIDKIFFLIITLSFFLGSNFIIYSHNGYVDLILSSYFAYLFWLIYLTFFRGNDFKKEETINLIFILAPISLNIKNEAIPFFIFILLTLVIYLSKEKLINKNFLSNIIFLIIFFLPFFGWFFYLKMNKILSFLDNHYLDFLKIENLRRIKIIFNYFFIEFLNTNKYGLSFITVIFALIFSLTILIFSKKITYKHVLLIFILLGQFLSYVYVYVITPLAFLSQLESSLERVLLQILPLIFILDVILLKNLIDNYKI